MTCCRMLSITLSRFPPAPWAFNGSCARALTSFFNISRTWDVSSKKFKFFACEDKKGIPTSSRYRWTTSVLCSMHGHGIISNKIVSPMKGAKLLYFWRMSSAYNFCPYPVYVTPWELPNLGQPSTSQIRFRKAHLEIFCKRQSDFEGVSTFADVL